MRAAPLSPASAGAGRRVGLKSVRCTVSVNAAAPPSITYSGSSAVTTGFGSTGTSAGGCGFMPRPSSVSSTIATAITATGTSHHRTRRTLFARSLIVRSFPVGLLGLVRLGKRVARDLHLHADLGLLPRGRLEAAKRVE